MCDKPNTTTKHFLCQDCTKAWYGPIDAKTLAHQAAKQTKEKRK